MTDYHTRPVKHLVQFSTGAASAEVAWRVVDEHGPETSCCSPPTPSREDDDNWRFAREVVDRLGCEWVILARWPDADGGRPGHRCVPSNRMAVCSRVLKRELLDTYRAEHFDPASTIVYLGYDWTELHRVEAAQKHWAPWTVDCPLTRPPHLWKQQILDLFRERGIEPPRLYGYGLRSCELRRRRASAAGRPSGRCCCRSTGPATSNGKPRRRRAARLLGKDVSILRDRTGGTPNPSVAAVFPRAHRTASRPCSTAMTGARAGASWMEPEVLGRRNPGTPPNRPAGDSPKPGQNWLT